MIVAAAAQAQPAPKTPALPASGRPRWSPLIPYFSIWSPADRLTDAATVRWTGRPHPLNSLVRVDGEPFRIMGATPADTAAVPQTSLAVHPTRTVYTFADKRVRITLTFLTPALPWDLDLLSRPVTYLAWDIVSADGKPHQVKLYADCGAEIAVNTPEQPVGLDYPVVEGLSVARMGTRVHPFRAPRRRCADRLGLRLSRNSRRAGRGGHGRQRRPHAPRLCDGVGSAGSGPAGGALPPVAESRLAMAASWVSARSERRLSPAGPCWPTTM